MTRMTMTLIGKCMARLVELPHVLGKQLLLLVLATELSAGGINIMNDEAALRGITCSY